jgi:hypothetical protein
LGSSVIFERTRRAPARPLLSFRSQQDVCFIKRTAFLSHHGHRAVGDKQHAFSGIAGRHHDVSALAAGVARLSPKGVRFLHLVGGTKRTCARRLLHWRDRGTNRTVRHIREREKTAFESAIQALVLW